MRFFTMCGRYELVDGKKIFVRFPVKNTTDAPELFDNRDMRPSQLIPTLLPDDILALTKWGFAPSWAKKPLINAKAEGLTTSKTFKRLLPANRCIIPGTAFYEWLATDTGKVPYVFRTDQDMFGFAGLYDEEQDDEGHIMRHSLIITTAPNAVVAKVHDRMPVILRPENEDQWLNPDIVEPERLMPLLTPYPANLMEAHIAPSSIFKKPSPTQANMW